MIGLIVFVPPAGGKRQKAVTVREQSILHMRFLCAQIQRGPRTPEAVVRRRVTAAAKRLHRAGAVRAVMPEAFAYQEQTDRCGVRPVSTLSLRRALAADWVRAVMEERGLSSGSTKVAVTADQLTGELVRAVTELSLRNRYVLLDLPYGGEDLCRQLRREYGVSLLLGPTREQLAGAEVLVMFDRREDLGGAGQVVLPLHGEQADLPPLVLPPALEEKMPQGADRGQMLAALREAGAIRPGQITVGRPGQGQG